MAISPPHYPMGFATKSVELVKAIPKFHDGMLHLILLRQTTPSFKAKYFLNLPFLMPKSKDTLY